jgi:hypothetical protein
VIADSQFESEIENAVGSLKDPRECAYEQLMKEAGKVFRLIAAMGGDDSAMDKEELVKAHGGDFKVRIYPYMDISPPHILVDGIVMCEDCHLILPA